MWKRTQCDDLCSLPTIASPQSLLGQIEDAKTILTKELGQAETMVSEQTATIEALKKQLAEAEEKLCKIGKEVAEKDAKVGHDDESCGLFLESRKA